jgi:hypothetical protein
VKKASIPKAWAGHCQVGGCPAGPVNLLLQETFDAGWSHVDGKLKCPEHAKAASEREVKK